MPPLKDVIQANQLLARKALGQHFLCDMAITREIAGFAGDLTGCTVFEIGPGPGGLTRALLETGAQKIIAIEIDPRCLIALAPLVSASQGRLEVIAGDAARIDPHNIAPSPRAIIANLPYNIGTNLLINWLHQMAGYKSLTLMFQAEVADRIIASPSSKSYGRLSVITQFCANATKVMHLPAQAFTPPPKVDSAVVHLTPRADRPKDIALKTLETITAAAFGQRRKMLRSSLKILGGEALLQACGIDPTLRAENLSLTDFENLARAYAKMN